MDKKLKIIFAGTPEFAVPSLQALAQDKEIEVLAVYTQPDRPVGRGQKLEAPPVKVFAKKNSFKVEQPEKLDSQEIEKLKRFSSDFIVVVAYGLILPKEVLTLPKHGCINLHASLLPKYRGASPIQAAILAGDTATGVSFMQLTKALDSGPVFEQIKVEIRDKNTEELSAELAQVGAKKLPEVLKKIAAGKLLPTKQAPAEASYCRKVQKVSGRVDWEKDTTEQLLRKLKAYTPWPGVWTTYKGEVLKLNQFSSFQFPVSNDVKLGMIFENSGKVGVKTIDKAIELKKVQLAGKKALAIAEFLRGEKDFVGARLV